MSTKYSKIQKKSRIFLHMWDFFCTCAAKTTNTMNERSILALAAIGFAACSNQPVQQNKSFMDLARQRYAVREYAQTPVEQAKWYSILEAGRLAPPAKNVQP